MPRPKGEKHHSASITLEQATIIKAALVNGASVTKVSSELDVPYQTVYRMAQGETWRGVEPIGPVNLVEQAIRGPKRRMSLTMWYLLWSKRRAGAPVKKLAERAHLSPSSIRRCVAEFELMMAARVSQLQLSSGSYESAKRKYGMTTAEARRLDDLASKSSLPSRLQKIVDNDFLDLEHYLNGKK